MSQKKYTATEWAAMEGGHSVEDTQMSFIQSLGEAKMFRTRAQIAGNGARVLSDHLLVSLMSLYAMSNDYKYAPVAREYAKRTVQLGNFNNPSPGGTDLYQTVFSLQRPELFGDDEADKMLMDKIKVDQARIKKFVTGIRDGNVTPQQAQQFFFRLEKQLKIQDPKLKAARRLTQDWTTLNSTQQKLVTTQIMRYFRLEARRSDLMPLYSNFAKDGGLLLDPEDKKSIAKSVAKGAAAFAAGYAIGKATPL